MSFNEFVLGIRNFLVSAGDNTDFQFTCDDNKGVYRAQHPDFPDYFITMPRGGTVGTANWHGHVARFSFS